MQTRQWLVRSSLLLSLLGGAALIVSVPANAAGDMSKSSTAATSAKTGEDDAAEFAKLDRNHDAYLDKTEAIREPKLLGKWGDADLNKDGKVSKDEYTSFERKQHAK